MLKRGKRFLKKGLTLLEAMLVLILLSAVVALAYKVYTMVMAQQEVKGEISTITAIMNMIDTVRVQSQGVLPAVDTLTSFKDIDMFAYYAKRIPALSHAKYKYSCVQNGDVGTVTIQIPLKSADMCTTIASSLKAKYNRLQTDTLKYDFTCSKNILTIKEYGEDIICEK